MVGGIRKVLKCHKRHCFRLIESAAERMRKPCTEILLDEWGTMGRVRPALGHLLHLLVTAELFRAADYVAVRLLNIEPPERPLVGPAARVNAELPQIVHQPIQIHQLQVNENLKEIAEQSNSVEYARNFDQSNVIVPEIVVSDISDTANVFQPVVQPVVRLRRTGVIEQCSPVVVENDESVDDSNVPEVLNQSSANNSRTTEQCTIPNVSDLLNQSVSDHRLNNNRVTGQSDVPNVSDLLNQTSSYTRSSYNSSTESYNSTTTVEDLLPSNNNIPDFSGLISNKDEEKIIKTNNQDSPNVSQTGLPDLSGLISSEKTENIIPDISGFSGLISNKHEENLPALNIIKTQNQNSPNVSQKALPDLRRFISLEKAENGIPDISGILGSNSAISSKNPTSDAIVASESYMPMLSGIMGNNGSEKASAFASVDSNIPNITGLLLDDNRDVLESVSSSLAENGVRISTTDNQLGDKGKYNTTAILNLNTCMCDNRLDLD